MRASKKREAVQPLGREEASSGPASVTLVTPSLNQGTFIEQAIQSVLSQDYPVIQYRVVDGGSTDRTMEILRKYDGRMAWVSEPDRGQAAAINKGMRSASTSSYVGWLNADDLLMPEGVSAMVSFLDRHPEDIAVFGESDVIDEHGERTGTYPTRPFNKRAFAVQCSISQPASLIRRWAWDAVGGLDESIDTCMDYDFWWRLSEIGRLGYLRQCVACSRDHAHTKTRMQRKKVNEEAISILLRHRGMVPRNWCMANILEGLEEGRPNTSLGRGWEAVKQYVLINRWKALLPQNWLL